MLWKRRKTPLWNFCSKMMIKRFRLWKETWKTFSIINTSTLSTILPGVSTTKAFLTDVTSDAQSFWKLNTVAYNSSSMKCHLFIHLSIHLSILYFQDVDYVLSNMLSAGSTTGNKMWQDSLLNEKDLITLGKP